MREIPKPGERYRHFKNKEYQILAVATHSETGEKMVVYQALYGEYGVWVRPLSMFMEEVDRVKYPEAAQRYRFERVTEPGSRMGEGPGIQAGEEPEEEKPMNPHLLEFFDAMDVRDYDKMLDAHKEHQADATIAVIQVPMKEASRFGIMNTDETGRIVEFEEKPEHPKSNLASMGIYIFNWKLLRRMLTTDMKNPDSSHDFGKDIIPQLLADGKTLFAYQFKGYWKDVGTIDSLWEANMDLLDKNNELDLNDSTWKIYTEDVSIPPQYIGENADIKRAFITQGCIIDGTVHNSVLFTGARVSRNAKVIDSVLMPGVEIAEGATVTRALVAANTKIGKGAVVGSADSEHIELVSKHVKGVE